MNRIAALLSAKQFPIAARGCAMMLDGFNASVHRE
jgi:hypothetical protein